MNGPSDAQRAAEDSDARMVMIAAGPGSGKTSTVVRRIAQRIHVGDRPDKIVALTFTNAAARELESRLGDLKVGFVGTLHAFALRTLREWAHAAHGARLSLISPDAAVDLLESKARTVKSRAPLKALLALKRSFTPGPRPTLDELAVSAYFADLRASHLLDLDDLLPQFLGLLRDRAGEFRGAWDALFVDESQDSAPIDWMIYAALPVPSKTFVGDPDQAIYGFRGGDVSAFVDLAGDPSAELHKLEENFRSGEQIVKCAQRLIERNENRVPKATRWATDFHGEVLVMDPFPNEGAELAAVSRAIHDLFKDGTPVSEVAVLCRTNAIAAEVSRGLIGAKIPVARRERVNLPPDWKLARAIAALCADPENDTLAQIALAEIAMSAGCDPKTAKADAHALRVEASAKGMPLHRSAPSLRGAAYALGLSGGLEGPPGHVRLTKESRLLIAEKCRALAPGASAADISLALAQTDFAEREPTIVGVRVMTIHAAKGLEFDAVFLVGCEDQAMPGGRSDCDVEEERRLCYVAITRARKFLSVSCALHRRQEWGDGIRTPSRFVAEMLGVAP